MATRSLHIAWLGPAPGEDGGVPGVACDLLDGLARLGHRIDCFFPSSGQTIPARLQGNENISFTWGTSEWRWDRWYSRTKMMAFASGIVARGLASVRLRGLVQDRHELDPYDVIYQFSSIESPAVPPRLTRTVPLVIHPETHAAGELRSMLAERDLALKCGSRWRFAAIVSIMGARTLTQALRIRRAALLVCISGVFRDHMVRDYRFPAGRTVVVPNPVRLERFRVTGPAMGERPTVLVLGRIAARKGLDDVVAVAKLLRERHVRARIRIVGGPSLWSDYTPLLEELPAETAEYAGAVPPAQVPAELAASALLLQASKYEPFALTIGEALACGVPVVGTSEVGAIESVDRSVAASVAPGDPAAMASAIAEMLDRDAEDPAAVAARARSEAERLFAPPVVCEQISAALLALTAQRAERTTAAA